MKPSTTVILVKLVKAAVKNPRRIPHLLGALRGFLRNRKQIRTWRLSAGDTMLISLIEHMGDIVAGEPIARLARRTKPGAAIGWVTRNPYAAIVKEFESVDSVITVQCMTEWLLLWSLQPATKTWDLHISERPCLHCGFSYRKPGRSGEITYRTYYDAGNLLTVNCLSADITPFDDTPRLVRDDAAIRAVDALGLPGRFVVIHCKSNEDRRDWQVPRWQALIEWIQANFAVSVIEVGSMPCIITKDDIRTRNLCGALSVAETTELLRRAALFIGIDSGPAHLANAAGTPGIVLLGHYENFKVYTPYSGGYGDGSRAELVRTDGPARDITLEAVEQAVARWLHGEPGWSDKKATSAAAAGSR